VHKRLLQARISELKGAIGSGGVREAIARAVLYLAMARASADERGFEMIRRMRKAPGEMPRLPLSEFKTLVREQYFMLLLDEDAALAAIPDLLPSDFDTRRKAFAVVQEVVSARGEITEEVQRRIERVGPLFGVDVARDTLVREPAKAARVSKAS
jgi:hypothetical protein